MEKKIAVVTGASAGIGREFVKLLVMKELDEIWAVARNPDKLFALKDEFGDKIVPISKDLSKMEEVISLGELLKEQRPSIGYLINNAGLARMGPCQDFAAGEIIDTINLNCGAPAVLCGICIPYMRRGSRILNISSASSFQPLPYLNLYSATKVFERYYSRALNRD